MTWRTMAEWNKKGRYITKGEKCKLKDPDGQCLWNKKQTSKSEKREDDGWDWEEGDWEDGTGADSDYEDYLKADTLMTMMMITTK